MDLFFVFKRAVGIAVQPLFAVFFLLLLALVLHRFTKRRRNAVACVVLAGIILFVASFPPLVRWQASLLESGNVPLPANATIEPAPAAIVVLGNGVAHPSDPGLPAIARLNDAARARLVEGVRLSRMFPGAALVTTGYGMGLENCGDAMAAAAVELGVDPGRVVGLPEALDTDHEATLAREVVGDGSIVLVTSAAHMPRALLYFRERGFLVVPSPCDFIAPLAPSVRSDINGSRWRPRGGSIADTEDIWHEWLGLAYYHWFRGGKNKGE